MGDCCSKCNVRSITMMLGFTVFSTNLPAKLNRSSVGWGEQREPQRFPCRNRDPADISGGVALGFAALTANLLRHYFIAYESFVLFGFNSPPLAA